VILWFYLTLKQKFRDEIRICTFALSALYAH
jgi:hypothetical protein